MDVFRAPLILDGSPLGFATLGAIGAGAGAVEVEPRARDRVDAGRAALEAALAAGVTVYGANTGVGAMKNWTPDPDDLAPFSEGLVLAHHFGVGDPMPIPVVRNAMAIRANTALSGVTGCSYALIGSLIAALGAGVTPVVRRIGSMGCADIGLMGQVGAVLGGSGEAYYRGARMAADRALAEAGLSPFRFRPKDGLVVLSSNAMGVAAAADAIHRAAHVSRLMLVTGLASAAAMGALHGAWEAATLVGSPGQARIGAWLVSAARGARAFVGSRVHDPLSLRMMPQVFGATFDALTAAGRAVVAETARVDDNPVVVEAGVLSSGGSLPIELVLAVEAAGLALAHLARNAMNRCVLLANGRLRDLPVNLVSPGSAMTGFGPSLKLAADLFQRVLVLAAPVSAQSLVVADGVEDEATFLTLAVERVEGQVAAMSLLAALEAILAAEALDLAGDRPEGLVARLRDLVRLKSHRRDRDRPLSSEIEWVAAALVADVEEPSLIETAPLADFDVFFAFGRPDFRTQFLGLDPGRWNTEPA